MAGTASGNVSHSLSKATFAGGVSVHLGVAKCLSTKVSYSILASKSRTIATTDVIEDMVCVGFNTNGTVKTVGNLKSGATISATGKVIPGSAPGANFTNALLLVLWSANDTT